MMESPEAFFAHVTEWFGTHWPHVCAAILVVTAYFAGQCRGMMRSHGKITSIQLKPINPTTLEVSAGPAEQMPAVVEGFDE